jgi:hypothetical protein
LCKDNSSILEVLWSKILPELRLERWSIHFETAASPWKQRAELWSAWYLHANAIASIGRSVLTRKLSHELNLRLNDMNSVAHGHWCCSGQMPDLTWEPAQISLSLEHDDQASSDIILHALTEFEEYVAPRQPRFSK